MAHHHHEHTHTTHTITSLNKAFIIGIVLNLFFVVAEFTTGFLSQSMGLLSDAGHNLSDVASLVLSMLAFRLAKVQSNSIYTYGYKKSTVLVSLLNAVILLVAVGVIIAESIEKLLHPQPVEGGVIMIVAGFGVCVNAFTAWLFIKDKEQDLNVKGAYLHMAADALVSVGVV
ncbi:MAG: cation diffusion facilitator family transporter, partial [Tannerella sp.]|nr:cation diffusion facilitator family transporter [Tannerella sp.]